MALRATYFLSVIYGDPVVVLICVLYRSTNTHGLWEYSEQIQIVDNQLDQTVEERW